MRTSGTPAKPPDVPILREPCYLIFDVQGIVSMTKRPPTLKAGQYAVKVQLAPPND